jgi:hypothetical protein
MVNLQQLTQALDCELFVPPLTSLNMHIVACTPPLHPVTHLAPPPPPVPHRSPGGC